AHRGAEARRVTARTGGAAVAARVPGEEIKFGQHELFDEVRHAPRVLVAAVEEHDRAACAAAHRRPMPVEELDPVMRAERALVDRAQPGTGTHVIHQASRWGYFPAKPRARD